jgi:hypothetical protein
VSLPLLQHHSWLGPNSQLHSSSDNSSCSSSSSNTKQQQQWLESQPNRPLNPAVHDISDDDSDYGDDDVNDDEYDDVNAVLDLAELAAQETSFAIIKNYMLTVFKTVPVPGLFYLTFM